MIYNYKSIFDDKKIPILSYNLETILAEKFQTIIDRSVLNTRLKDFYDIYILINTKFNKINIDELFNAIKNTFKKRNTKLDTNYSRKIVDMLKNDNYMMKLWEEYSLKNSYAKGISYLDTINAISKIVKICDESFNN